MFTRNWRRFTLVTAMMVIAGLILSACAGGGAGTGDGKKITIGYITWDEDIAVTFLWKALLEERGYEVDAPQVDVAPVFAGVADGNLDLFFDVWMPSTHHDYMEDFGDDVDIIGTWFDQADLGWAVPDYVDVHSMDELADSADLFDSRIVGIEPGAGLMRVSMENAMPGYGLDGWDLVEASTPAMLAELDRAIDAEEPILVTLWRPHWAFGAYPIRYLEDPEGLMNPDGAEEIKIIARKGFTDEFPEVTRWLGNFWMEQDDLAELEVLVLEADDEMDGVREWLSDEANRKLTDAWFD